MKNHQESIEQFMQDDLKPIMTRYCQLIQYTAHIHMQILHSYATVCTKASLMCVVVQIVGSHASHPSARACRRLDRCAERASGEPSLSIPNTMSAHSVHYANCFISLPDKSSKHIFLLHLQKHTHCIVCALAEG